MPQINISKYATGSWPRNIGDTTLFYSGNSSRHAKDVEGFFLDNPPQLSADCAGLVWRYYQDTDSYLLIHVQGSQVVNAALGRNYPFRAGYEISRDDMNVINFNIPAILKAVPRISTMTSGRVPLETDVNERTPWPEEGSILRQNIQNAFYNGKLLYIALDISDRRYHEDGIFDASELRTLLGAISGMPKDIQRYISFAFCVDYNYEKVLEDVQVVVYLSNRRIRVPENAINLNWYQAITEKVVRQGKPYDFLLSGLKAPLMSFSQIQRFAIISRKRIDDIQGEEWNAWIQMGHNFSELRTSNWNVFVRYYRRMDEKTRREYIETVKADSVKWELAGLTEELFNIMDYDKDLQLTLQCKTEALKSVLLGVETYSFLYPKGELSNIVRLSVNAQFIKELNLSNIKEIKKWYKIITDNNRADDVNIQKEFESLFDTYVIPNLNSLEEIINCMQKYPFVSVSKYQKPNKIIAPSDKELAKLKPELKAVVEKWIEEEASIYKFNKIEEIIRILESTKNLNAVEKIALVKLQKETVVNVLLSSNDIWGNCEKLLSLIVSLPKSWTKQATNVFLPAVIEVLWGNRLNSEISDMTLLDVSTWVNTCKKYKKYPYVFHLVKKKLASLVVKKNANEMMEQIKQHYILSIGYKNGKHDDGTTAIPSKRVVNTDIPMEVCVGNEDGVITTIDNPQCNAKKKDFQKNHKEKKHKGKLNGKKAKEGIFDDNPNDSEEKYSEDACDAYPFIKICIKKINDMNNKEAEGLENLFKELKTVKTKKRTRRRIYILMGLCFIAGLIIRPLIMPSEKNATDYNQKDVATIQKVCERAKNPMLQLADSFRQGKTIIDFVCEDMPYTLQLDSLNTLIPVSKEYANAKKKNLKSAIAYFSIKTDDAKIKKDTVIISGLSNNTLIQVASHKGYRLDKIVIGSVSIDIPDKLVNNQTEDMSHSACYFEVISYIDSCLSEELSLKVAY